VRATAIRQFAEFLHESTRKGTIVPVQKKVFWMLVLVLGTLADIVLPLLWGLVATIPIVFLSWWIVYRSNWLDL